MNPLDFIMAVVFLSYKYRGSVSSWGRTLKHNTDVGGVSDSWHMLWLGCDVVLDEMKKNKAFVDDAKALGLRAIWEKDHYHLQPMQLAA